MKSGAVEIRDTSFKDNIAGDLAGDFVSRALVNLGFSGCTSSSPCTVCKGDCDSDNDCSDSLRCFQRTGKTAVPGCSSGGSGDTNDMDYCYQDGQVNPVLLILRSQSVFTVFNC
jgi:hypothetical protein